jgi:hypothetical protein
MASETTTTSANDPIFTSWIDGSIQQEQRPYIVCKPHFDVKGPGLPTKRFDWPTQDDPGEAADLTEGTEMGNTALGTGVASATAAADGMSATTTKLLEHVMVGDAVGHFSGVLARSVAEAEENEAANLLGGFSSTVGSTGADLTLAQFQSAVSTLEQADADGPLVAILHPVQVGDLRAATTVTSNAFYLGNPNLNESILQDISRPAGFVGQLFGVPIYQTSAVATANTAADRAGAVFVDRMALGWYDVWTLDVQTHPDIQQPGTIIAATSCKGVVEILDRRGVSVITDA